ncbi:hypothetical protein AB0H83_38805 [Dactylosporangium sp. NPDC050688]|uniref:hypothetical protein n=1 Tax=Dactylosporangium sp. NPDC050688 TaxID=3157217 RepID=UPI0033FF9F95
MLDRKVDRIADPWGERTPYAAGEAWPVRVDGYLAGGLTESIVDGWFQSASVLHSNGDAMDVAVKDGRIVGVRAGRSTGSTVAGSTRRTSTAGRPTTAGTG